MDDDKLEQTAFTALAVMEEAAKVTKEIQRSAEDALQRLPEAARSSIEGVAREILVEATQEASRGLLEASRETAAASAALIRSGAINAIYLLGVALVIVAIVYFGAKLFISNQFKEIASLRQQVAEEESTLKALKSKSWNLELETYNDGRGIILPKGVNVEKSGSLKDGRQIILITP